MEHLDQQSDHGGWGCVKKHKYISKYICQSKNLIVKKYKYRCR